MQERIWTTRQLARLEELKKDYDLPQEVIHGIHKVVEILDTYYGWDRDVDADNGGYVLLIIPEEESWESPYPKLLDKYFMKPEDAEFQDIIYEDAKMEWHSDLYIIGSDYGITVIYAREKGRFK